MIRKLVEKRKTRRRLVSHFLTNCRWVSRKSRGNIASAAPTTDHPGPISAARGIEVVDPPRPPPPSPPLRSRRNGYRTRSCSSLDRFQTPRHAEYRCLIGELKRFERERGSVNFSSFINSNTSNCRPRCSPSKKIFLPILRRFARSKDCGLWFGVGERKWGGGRRGRVTVFHWDVA